MTPLYSTADVVLTQVRAETGIGSNPHSTALQNTAMLRQLEDVNSEFVNYPYSVGVLGWPFLWAEQIVSTIASTTLNGAISSGATSLILTSGTGWDSPSSDLGAGYIEIGAQKAFDIFTFESRSSATLSTVSGIQYAHTNASAVHKMYKLNSDFGKPRNLFRESNNYEFFFDDGGKRQIPVGRGYTIRNLVSTNGYTGNFLIFRDDIGAYVFKLYYVKGPSTISATTDSVQAPNGVCRRYIIEKMNEYVWHVKGEENDAIIAGQRAERAMQKALSEWSTQTVQPNQSLTLSF